MVKFSQDLSDVLLPHDPFGTYLNSQGKTVNTDLERKNVAYAGKLLAEIWSDTVIDGHPTVSSTRANQISKLTKKKVRLEKVNIVYRS